MARCFLTFGSIERLPPLSGCPALLHLDLSFNCLGRTEDVQSFTSCPLLQRLHLNDNPVAAVPLYRALVIACCPCLVELDANPVEESQRLASVDALGVASRRWAGLIAAARGVHCGGSATSQPFYQEVASTTGGQYLPLDSLQTMTDTFAALCLREVT